MAEDVAKKQQATQIVLPSVPFGGLYFSSEEVVLERTGVVRGGRVHGQERVDHSVFRLCPRLWSSQKSSAQVMRTWFQDAWVRCKEAKDEAK